MSRSGLALALTFLCALAARAQTPEAEKIGLVLESVPGATLLDRAYEKAAEIMLNSPIGVALTKEGMWSALEIPGMQAAIDLELIFCERMSDVVF